jgi:hypothetical protein
MLLLIVAFLRDLEASLSVPLSVDMLLHDKHMMSLTHLFTSVQ